MIETMITPEIASKKIYATKGRMFSCIFIKKDKTIRKMICRLHVKKYLKHGGKVASTTAHIKKYITVFEMCGEAEPVYKNINVETMITLHIEGEKFIIAHEATG
jgi:hypothetical protein